VVTSRLTLVDDRLTCIDMGGCQKIDHAVGWNSGIPFGSNHLRHPQEHDRLHL
jgi:hypothetical protein